MLDAIVCGATFDHFHIGHGEFLNFALKRGNKVLLGVTSDTYVKKLKLNEDIEPFEKRLESVKKYLVKNNVADRVEFASIDNIFIPSIWNDKKIDAIVVTADTKKGAEKINNKRILEGKKALEILESPLVLATDGKIISSSRIRDGEINREGRLYLKQSWLVNTLYITDLLRTELKRPFGKLIVRNGQEKNIYSSRLSITVGDVISKYFNENKYNHAISIVDLAVARERKFSNVLEHGFTPLFVHIKATNPAGSLTPDLFVAMQKAFRQVQKGSQVVLEVMGEEDLAVLPSILCAPLGAQIFYGQPGEGYVQIDITEEVKEKVFGLVSKFSLKK